MKKETVKSRIEAQLEKYNSLFNEVLTISSSCTNRETAIKTVSKLSEKLQDLAVLEKETDVLYKEETSAQRGRIQRIGQLQDREISLRIILLNKIEDLIGLQLSLAKRQLAKKW